MISWLTGTTVGKLIATFFISMVPMIELRVGLVYGIGFGLDYWKALLAALIGNMVPVPFIVIYIEQVFKWLRGRYEKLDRFISRQEERASSKKPVIDKYGPLGLLIFVAIPLPGTGAWTGALIAALMQMKLKHALPSIFLGVCIAAAIITGLTYSAIAVL